MSERRINEIFLDLNKIIKDYTKLANQELLEENKDLKLKNEILEEKLKEMSAFAGGSGGQRVPIPPIYILTSFQDNGEGNDDETICGAFRSMSILLQKQYNLQKENKGRRKMYFSIDTFQPSKEIDHIIGAYSENESYGTSYFTIENIREDNGADLVDNDFKIKIINDESDL